jgi:cytochrome b6-f complex iron-sulfur subunit
LRLAGGCGLVVLGAGGGCSADGAVGQHDRPGGSPGSGTAPASPTRLAEVSAVPPDGALDVSAAAGRPAYLVKGQNTVRLLSGICTHAGCLVAWQEQRERFICPCHGGSYDRLGAVASGPPLRPLDHLPIRVESGTVYLPPDASATP